MRFEHEVSDSFARFERPRTWRGTFAGWDYRGITWSWFGRFHIIRISR